jgi:hypothetical protein
VSYQNALNEAVLRATTASQRFKPELGYDFSTYLRHYLKKLYAMQEEEKGWSHAAPIDWAQDQEAAPKPAFPRGANGTRLAFDRWQWAGDDQRKGVVVGLRLRDNSVSYSTGVTDRISVALDILRGDDNPGALGRVKAAIDHLERRQREAEAEAEDRHRGVYNPTFLEAHRLAQHVERYRAHTPRHSSLYPVKEVEDLRGRWGENWQNQLGTILYKKGSKGRLTSNGLSGEEIDWAEVRFREIAGPVLKPFLSSDERAVWDWIGNQMFDEEAPRVTAEELATGIGRSKRTIYKIRDRLILKLKKELK